MICRRGSFLVSSLMKRGRIPGPRVIYERTSKALAMGQSHRPLLSFAPRAKTVLCASSWRANWEKTHLLVEVLLSPSVVVEFELGRSDVAQVGLHDAQRVERGGVVAPDLVGSDEELDLEVVAQLSRLLAQSGRDRGGVSTDGSLGRETGRRAKGLRRGEALVEAGEVGRPRDMNRLGVLQRAVWRTMKRTHNDSDEVDGAAERRQTRRWSVE
jgi:hypothetical protein